MTVSASPHRVAARPQDPPLLAALDLGTNNCRLLVARPEGEGFEVVDSFSRIVRLGEGLAATGRLAERAMARTMAALRICARIIARHRVRHVRCVATEACRRAANGAEFLARVHRSTGLTFEILPQEEEARLALLGCLPLIDRDAAHVLVVDIGGGSTELLWLDRLARGRGVLRSTVSLPAGVVALAETFGSEPDASAYAAMVDHVQTRLAPVESRYGIGAALRGHRVQMLGTSGTVTTLAAIHLDLPRYDRRKVDGLMMEPRAIARVSARLRQMTNASRMRHPCIGPGRADLVVAGCAILEAVLRCWPATSLRVADRGLREGILHGLMGRDLDAALASLGTLRPQPSVVS